MERDDIYDRVNDSETDLWLAFRQGHKAAFSELYKKCYGKLYSYAIYLGMDDAVAPDAIQDLFLKLYEKPDIITDASTLLPFLFRSIRNYFINLVKKKAMYVDIDQLPFTFGYTIDEDLTAEEDRKALEEQVQKLLSCLTSRQKEVVYFRFFYEMEYEEIARIMNISQQGARNMLHKALEKIRNYPPPC
ncbi:MAG: sigma-70 family RNA polymerase sigma factor [Tannerella sp.]|jgi:RNA polymerase sigma factor (sigma-70 family)|nr:sigma-70 family RNA polymerase sigma factor [Tannerella sp.]